MCVIELGRNMIFKFIALCYLIIVISIDRTRAKSTNNLSNQRSTIWTINAVDYLRNITCDHIFYNVLKACLQMKRTPNNQIRVYSAQGVKGGKLLTVLPDGPLSRSTDHDGVLVLDPFPQASFGHLIFVFFVEHMKSTSASAQDRHKCEIAGGVFIESYNDCLKLALRDGCHRSMRQKRRRTNNSQRCEIDLLPSVYEASNSLESDVEIASGQKLRCRTIAGFASCPSGTRTLYDSACDEDDTTAECASKLAPKLTNVRCRLFETCDHAVVLYGGWNRLTAKDSDLHTLQETRTMLVFNGYSDDNVKTFYANGEIHLPGISTRNLYPASAKNLLRQHLRNVCQQSHCVDTLAVFIKAPSMHDGSLLLWDLDGSGIANEDEMYQPNEFVDDVSNCLAKQVYIVADYSYSGRLAEAFRNAKSKLKNIVLVTSGNEYEFSWNGELTKLWFTQSRRTKCFKDIVEIGRETIKESNPDLFDGGDNESGTTLSGAPCNVVPPFTEDELKEKYFGCQNVPSLTWFRRAAVERIQQQVAGTSSLLSTEKPKNFLFQRSSNVTETSNFDSKKRRRSTTS